MSRGASDSDVDGAGSGRRLSQYLLVDFMRVCRIGSLPTSSCSPPPHLVHLTVLGLSEEHGARRASTPWATGPGGPQGARRGRGTNTPSAYQLRGRLADR